MRRLHILLITFLMLIGGVSGSAQTTKRERNHNREGVSLFNKKRYAEAEVEFRKALQENAASEVAAFNLAAALLQQAGAVNPEAENKPLAEAMSILNQLSKSSTDTKLAENSFYNLGNIAYNSEKYDQAIDLYKQALRRNPDNDKARENLRMAQLKLQQQNNDQNQDKNNDQNQDKNQDQNKDQNKDQDQNKNQNQDQNQDQNKDQQQQPHGGMSDANAEQILKAMENAENATRQRVEAKQAREERNATSRQHLKPW